MTHTISAREREGETLAGKVGRFAVSSRSEIATTSQLRQSNNFCYSPLSLSLSLAGADVPSLIRLRNRQTHLKVSCENRELGTGMLACLDSSSTSTF